MPERVNPRSSAQVLEMLSRNLNLHEGNRVTIEKHGTMWFVTTNAGTGHPRTYFQYAADEAHGEGLSVAMDKMLDDTGWETPQL